jgi:hypothetical protein
MQIRIHEVVGVALALSSFRKNPDLPVIKLTVPLNG